MKQDSKKKARKITGDGDDPPPLRRPEEGLDTAYFIAEATLKEPPEPSSPAPTEEPPAPAAAPPPPLAPLAALWPTPGAPRPESKPAPAPPPQVQTTSVKADEPEASPAPAVQPLKPPARSAPAKLPGRAVADAEARVPSAPPRVKVTFVLLDPGAKQVSLAGDFNGWSPDATPMKSDEAGRWTTTVELAPGRHQYRFVSDGQWIIDPLGQEKVSNQHSTLNSVVEVRA